jgi:hypothetical protein
VGITVEYDSARNRVHILPRANKHYLDIEPSCPWQVIFAEHETHFDQIDIINVLNKNNAVEIASANSPHGFINSLSSQYNKAESEQLINVLVDYLVSKPNATFCNTLPNSYQKFGKRSDRD